MRKLNRWLLLLALSLMATTGSTQKTPRAPAAPKPAKLSPEGERWVAQTLKQMSLDEKIGQLFAVWAYGSFLSTESQDYKDLLRDVEEKHIGTFAIQTQGSPLGVEYSQVYPTAILVNTLQKHAKVPLLIGADFERGTSMRVEEGASFPHAMAVGATNRPEDAYTMGKITALEGKAVGVPWIFAPENTPLGKKVPEATAFDYLKTLAISRLYLDNIDHIQSSWLTPGIKICQVGLQFGADDVGSILIEENVVFAAGVRNRTNEEELRRIISDAGYIPAQRDTLYLSYVLK